MLKRFLFTVYSFTNYQAKYRKKLTKYPSNK
jgi:hypothetical protein